MHGAKGTNMTSKSCIYTHTDKKILKIQNQHNEHHKYHYSRSNYKLINFVEKNIHKFIMKRQNIDCLTE